MSGDLSDLASLLAKISAKGAEVRGLKAEGIDPAFQVAELLSLKARYKLVAGTDVPGAPVLQSKKHRKQGEKAAAPAAAPVPLNGVPWPAVENYLTVVAGQVKQGCGAAKFAATYIQRWWRAVRAGDRHFTAGAGLRRELRAVLPTTFRRAGLVGCGAVGTLKLDGTNVGVCDDRSLLGRRTVIDPELKRYQRTLLTDCRALDAGAIRAELVKEVERLGGLVPPPVRLAVYGELMCNGGLHDYERTGLAGRWVCFGAQLLLTDGPGDDAGHAVGAAAVAAAAELVAALQRSGFCTTDHALVPTGGRQITVMMNAKLRSILLRHGAALVAKPVEASTQLALVQQMTPFMEQHQGEGVIMYTTRTDRFGRSTVALSKWKSSAEPGQRGALKHITKALAAASRHELGAAVPAELLELLRALVKIASTQEAPCVGGPKLRYGRETEVGIAIASALTKFDSLDAYFERGDVGVAEINLALLREVIDDVAGSQTTTPDDARLAVAEMLRKTRQAWTVDQERTPPQTT